MTAVGAVLTGESWVQDELDLATNEAGWHKGSLFVQASWNDSTTLNLFQSTAFSGTGTAPGSHTGDSGSDHVVRVLGNSGVNYYAFTDAGSGPVFAYFAVEYAAGFWRHFGFGNLVKLGGWSGGEFCYGHEWDQSASQIDTPNSASHSVLIDGSYNASIQAATIKIVGTEWPNAPASSVWGVSHANATVGNDNAGNGRYRCMGASRRGPFVQQFGVLDSSGTTTYIPGSPIPVIAKDPTYVDPEHWYWMGTMPLIYVGSMLNFTPAQQVTIGSETWRVFPITRQATSPADTEFSGNGSVWYREA
jgi:hypothetical protein